MDTLDRFTPTAVGLLDDARRLRFLDDAIRVAREDLDETAGLIVGLPCSARVPAESYLTLREIVSRIDRLERERAELLEHLPTVPARV